MVTILVVMGCAPAFVTSALAGQSPTVAVGALTNWQVALKCFQNAGASIGQDKPDQARVELTAAATNLPPPYSTMAAQLATQLGSALGPSADPKSPKRVKALMKLCAELRAYDVALRLQSATSSAEDLEDDPTYAWRLFETGQLPAALAEYQRKLAAETVENFADYYRDTIRLVEQRATNLTSVPFALQLVRLHYLKGLEEKADSLSALQELYRVLPHATQPTQGVVVVEAIISRLIHLGDDLGRDAWEDRLLSEFKSSPEACASVRLERGLRAYASKDYPKALALLRPVCAEHPDTRAYGDAQYTVALALQQQGKLAEAVAEYKKIFPSKVRDHDLDLEKSDDCKNYRHRAALRISECYATQANFAEAISYVEQARDRYLFNSYCKNCIKDNKAFLETRIAELRALLAQQSPASAKP